MKLRNKKTGKVLDLECITVFDRPGKNDIGDSIDEFYTIAELNAEWEDYKPAEPLIKDEKVRNLVKNFALSTNATWIQYESTVLRGEFWMEGGFIGNNGWKELEGLVNHQCYTLAELCGEEKE